MTESGDENSFGSLSAVMLGSGGGDGQRLGFVGWLMRMREP